MPGLGPGPAGTLVVNSPLNVPKFPAQARSPLVTIQSTRPRHPPPALSPTSPSPATSHQPSRPALPPKFVEAKMPTHLLQQTGGLGGWEGDGLRGDGLRGDGLRGDGATGDRATGC